jgi:hypothetical protein
VRLVSFQYTVSTYLDHRLAILLCISSSLEVGEDTEMGAWHRCQLRSNCVGGCVFPRHLAGGSPGGIPLELLTDPVDSHAIAWARCPLGQSLKRPEIITGVVRV